MKHYINNSSKLPESPCKKCEYGWGSYSNGKDHVGEYIKVESCHDNCVKLKKFIEVSKASKE